MPALSPLLTGSPNLSRNVLSFLQSDLPYSRANAVSRVQSLNPAEIFSKLGDLNDFCDDFCLEIGLLIVKLRQCTRTVDLPLESQQQYDGAIGRLLTCLETLLNPDLKPEISRDEVVNPRLVTLRKRLILARKWNKSFADLDQALGGVVVFPIEEAEQRRFVKTISKCRHVLQQACCNVGTSEYDGDQNVLKSIQEELHFLFAKGLAYHASRHSEQPLLPGLVPESPGFLIYLSSIDCISQAQLYSAHDDTISEAVRWLVLYRDTEPPYDYLVSEVIGLMQREHFHRIRPTERSRYDPNLFTSTSGSDIIPKEIRNLETSGKFIFGLDYFDEYSKTTCDGIGRIYDDAYDVYQDNEHHQDGYATAYVEYNYSTVDFALVTYAPPTAHRMNATRLTSLESIMEDISSFTLRERFGLCYGIVKAIVTTSWTDSTFNTCNIVFVSLNSAEAIDLSSPWLQYPANSDQSGSDSLHVKGIYFDGLPLLMDLGILLLRILYHDHLENPTTLSRIEGDTSGYPESAYLKAWETIEHDRFDTRIRRGCATAIKACLRQDMFPTDIENHPGEFRQLIRDNIVRPLELDYRSYLYETELTQNEKILGITIWQTETESNQSPEKSIVETVSQDETVDKQRVSMSHESKQTSQKSQLNYIVTTVRKAPLLLFDNDEEDDTNSIKRADKWLQDLDKYLAKTLGPVVDLIFAAEAIQLAFDRAQSFDGLIQQLVDEPDVTNLFDESGLREMLGHNSHSYETQANGEVKDIVLQINGLSVTLSEATRRTKIAILDTGIDLKVPALQGYRDRILEMRNWVHDSEEKVDITNISDRFGHGTHTASLLLRSAPAATICVARIANNEFLDNDEYVAEAIEWAVDFCNADIITMSFGFNEHSPAVENAILAATAKKKIFFAATSNEGGNNPVAYPARYEQVIGVSSCDGKGNPSNFNPNPIDLYPFATLGESVKSAWPLDLDDKTGSMRRSGTSFATPILAGLAASLIDYTRIRLGIGPEKLHRLRTTAGIKAILRLISERRDKSSFYYVAPWIYWAKQGEETGFFKHNFLHALQKA